MKQVHDFLNKYSHAILWSVFYGLIVWGILRWLFNFNIFSGTHWAHIARARIHGFAGFAFGILILAAVPLYIATTTVIIRNGPLFEFKYIKKIMALFTPTTPQDDTPPPASDTPETNDNTPAAPKKIMPGEIVGAYANAKNHVARMAHISDSDADTQSTPENITHEKIPVPEPVMADGMPLPTDFDVDTTDNDDASGFGNDFMGMGMDMTIPNFTDISFGDAPDVPAPPAFTPTQPGDIETFLGKRGVKIISNEDDIIITDKFAIASHTDDDFWVVDNESWFAAGKQKTSPTKAVMTAATAHDVTPVFYLTSNNIMDIDKHRVKWENDGILIISSPNQLPL